MPSSAKREWDTFGSSRLDELQQLHVDARGTGRRRRWGTEQLNRSLFLVLVAQFQTYCRDLHDEAVAVHVAQANPGQAAVLQKLMTQGRRLDTGNPRSDALENDFGRLGFELLPALRTARGGMHRQLFRLNVLIDFRNLVSHGNETSLQTFVASNDIQPTLTSYKRYRRTVNTLVGTMDRVVAAQLASGLRVPRPW